jgi:hypothetical protein
MEMTRARLDRGDELRRVVASFGGGFYGGDDDSGLVSFRSGGGAGGSSQSLPTLASSPMRSSTGVRFPLHTRDGTDLGDLNRGQGVTERPTKSTKFPTVHAGAGGFQRAATGSGVGVATNRSGYPIIQSCRRAEPADHRLQSTTRSRADTIDNSAVGCGAASMPCERSIALSFCVVVRWLLVAVAQVPSADAAAGRASEAYPAAGARAYEAAWEQADEGPRQQQRQHCSGGRRRPGWPHVLPCLLARLLLLLPRARAAGCGRAASRQPCRQHASGGGVRAHV